MNTIEIHPPGSFNKWDGAMIRSFRETCTEHRRSSRTTTNVGTQLLFENEDLKVWSIELAPNESLPFHKHTTHYHWTVMTAGSALSHDETGRVVAITYNKGDLSYYNHDVKGDFVHNLKNTGQSLLAFITVEYKKQ